MDLNSVLHIPKLQGNFNMPGSFATILFNAIREDGELEFYSIKKYGEFRDSLVILYNGKKQTVVCSGNDCVNNIIKRIKKLKN